MILSFRMEKASTPLDWLLPRQVKRIIPKKWTITPMLIMSSALRFTNKKTKQDGIELITLQRISIISFLNTCSCNLTNSMRMISLLEQRVTYQSTYSSTARMSISLTWLNMTLFEFEQNKMFTLKFNYHLSQGVLGFWGFGVFRCQRAGNERFDSLKWP